MSAPISTRLDEPVIKRIEAIASKDCRSKASVIEICVLRYLPELEKELADLQAARERTKVRKAA